MQSREQIEMKRVCFLETGFRLFSEKGIDAVSLKEIAEATEFGTATMYRHFDKKPGFVVAVAAWEWGKFASKIWERSALIQSGKKMNSAENFEYYLDSFLELYRERRDLLRFNQFFNIYIQNEKIDPETMKPYKLLIMRIKEQFHIIYEKALEDHMLRTEVPEDEMFSATLHLMLAAVTRYAVGLAYRPEEFDEMKELDMQKEMLLKEYRS